MDEIYAITKSGNTIIGLFEGLFENNILTFNSGGSQYAKNLEDFDDLRTIQKYLKAKGLKLDMETDE
jgi:hypothetical protein